eukprot:scaffold9141_cov70-Phaeocystis_antarctica.AAC.4
MKLQLPPFLEKAGRKICAPRLRRVQQHVRVPQAVPLRPRAEDGERGIVARERHWKHEPTILEGRRATAQNAP